MVGEGGGEALVLGGFEKIPKKEKRRLRRRFSNLRRLSCITGGLKTTLEAGQNMLEDRIISPFL